MEKKLLQLKERISELKEKIRERAEALDGDMTLSEASASLKKIEEDSFEFKVRKELQGHLGKITSIAWGGDRVLISAGQDGKLILWDGILDSKIEVISLKYKWVLATDVSPGDKYLSSAGVDRIVTIYDISQIQPGSNEQPQILREMKEHEGYVSDLVFISENQIISSSSDMSSILWDVESGALLQRFQGHENDVSSLTYTEKRSQVFISGSEDHTARLWDIRTGAQEMTFKNDLEDSISCVRFFPDGNLFGATYSNNSTASMYDLRMIREIVRYQDEDSLSGMTSLDFSISGRVLFVGSEDYMLRAFDTLKGTLIRRFEAHANIISSVRVSPDGYGVATGSHDKEIKIWA